MTEKMLMKGKVKPQLQEEAALARGWRTVAVQPHACAHKLRIVCKLHSDIHLESLSNVLEASAVLHQKGFKRC